MYPEIWPDVNDFFSDANGSGFLGERLSGYVWWT